jgi:hypothetical protein
VCCRKDHLHWPDMAAIDALPEAAQAPFLAELRAYAEEWGIEFNEDALRREQAGAQDTQKDASAPEQAEAKLGAASTAEAVPAVPIEDLEEVPAGAGVQRARITMGMLGILADRVAKLPADAKVTIQALLPKDVAPGLVWGTLPDEGAWTKMPEVSITLPHKELLLQCIGFALDDGTNADVPIQLTASSAVLPTPEGAQPVPTVPIPQPAPEEEPPTAKRTQTEAAGEIMEADRWCLWAVTQEFGKTRAFLTQAGRAAAIHAAGRRSGRSV